MIIEIYELKDATGKVVYVGETKNPKHRLWTHMSKRGKFHDTKVTMHIVEVTDTKEKARVLEEQLQIFHGLQTDRDKKRIGGSTMTPKRKAALIASNKKRAL